MLVSKTKNGCSTHSAPATENSKLVAYKSYDYVSEKHTGEAVIHSARVTVAIQGESTQVP